MQVMNDIAERVQKIHHEDAFAEDTTSITHYNDLLIDNVESLSVYEEDSLREDNTSLVNMNSPAILRDTAVINQMTTETNDSESRPEIGSDSLCRITIAPLLIENGAAILRDSPGTRQVTVERHEDQSQKEAPSPPHRRLAKAASMPSLGNTQSQSPQLGPLPASRTSQTTAGSNGDRSQQGTRSIKFRIKGAQHSGISLNEALERVPLSQGTAYLLPDVSMDHSNKISLKIRWSGYRSTIYSIPLSADYHGYVDMQSLARRTARATVHFMGLNSISLPWNRVVLDRLEEKITGVWIPVLMQSNDPLIIPV